MTVDPLLVGRIHDGFTGGPNGNRFLEVSSALSSHPGHFSRKAFHMVLFSVEGLLRNEHREVGVLHPDALDPPV